MENKKQIGMIIEYERLKRNWSLQGLSKGICSVSYLSKIENGTANPSEEVLTLLFKRLGMNCSSELVDEAAKVTEDAYESLFSAKNWGSIIKDEYLEKYKATSYIIDLSLIDYLEKRGSFDREFFKEISKAMDSRQGAMFALAEEKFSEALALFPNTYTYYWNGINLYSKGKYNEAVESMNKAYDLASSCGQVMFMFKIKLVLGNSYANLFKLDEVKRQYTIARNISLCINDEDVSDFFKYNIHSTEIEMGIYEDAYKYFSSLKKHTKLSSHKYAVVCELMGKNDEALKAVKLGLKLKGDDLDAIYDSMLELVLYRLEHEDYLNQEEYRERLIGLFKELENNLPISYSNFHVRWLVEYYRATRQYKKIIEVLKKFPGYSALM